MEEVEVTKKSAEKVKRVVRAIGMSFKIVKNCFKVFIYFFLTRGKVPAHQTDESNTESESDTKKSKVRKEYFFYLLIRYPSEKERKEEEREKGAKIEKIAQLFRRFRLLKLRYLLSTQSVTKFHCQKKNMYKIFSTIDQLKIVCPLDRNKKMSVQICRVSFG